MKSTVTYKMEIGIFEIKVAIYRNGRRVMVKFFDANEYSKAEQYAEGMVA